MRESSKISSRRLAALLLPCAVLLVGFIWTGTLGTPLILLAVGLAAILQIDAAIRSDVKLIAEIESQIYERALDQQHRLALDQSSRENRLELAATIHDSVINTLCAANLSPQAQEDRRLQERCETDLDYLRAYLDDPRGTPRSRPSSSGSSSDWPLLLKDELATRSMQLGIDVEFDMDETLSPIGPEKYGAMELACREALTNVAKHSKSRLAIINMHQGQIGPVVTVIDVGGSWNHHGTASIDEFSLFSFGQRVDVEVSSLLPGDSSSIHGGIAVRIRPSDVSLVATQHRRLAIQDYIRIPLARVINFWLTGVSIIAIAVAFAVFPWWWWLFAGVLTVSASMTFVNVHSIHGRIAQSWSHALAVSAGVLVASPILVVESGQGGWSPQWLVLLPASILLVTASWTAQSKRAAWQSYVAIVLGSLIFAFYQNPDASTVLTAPILVCAVVAIAGAAIVLVFFKVDQQIERSATEAQRRLEEVGVQAIKEDIEENRSTLVQDLIGRCMSAAEPVLHEIAEGNLDTSDPVIQQRVQSLERLLRSAISLGREQDQLSSTLFSILWYSQDRDIDFHVRSYRSDSAQADCDFSDLDKQLRALIDSHQAGTRMAVSTYQVESTSKLLVVVTSPDGSSEEIVEFALNQLVYS